MAYIYKSTLLGGCNADTGDAPDQPADCKFIAPGEDISTYIANRPHLQLAENIDFIRTAILRNIAQVEVQDFTHPGSRATIIIDPTGGAGGDINVAQEFYLGYSGWTDDQETRDRIFQVLEKTDQGYEEVYVDDGSGTMTEVAVTGVQVSPGGADLFGSGFYDSAVFELTLNINLPAGSNYRLVCARASNFETFPEYGLLTSDVRGLEEASAQTSFKNKLILVASGGGADYVGNTAVEDAITDQAAGEGRHLYIKGNTLNQSTSMSIDKDDVHIEGQWQDETEWQFGNSTTLTISGSRVLIENLSVIASTGQFRILIDNATPNERITLRNLNIGSGYIHIGRCSNVLIENCIIGGYQRALYVGAGACVTFKNCTFTGATAAGTAYNVQIEQDTAVPSNIKFDNCIIEGGNASVDQYALFIDEADGVTFNDCLIDKKEGVASNCIYLHSDNSERVVFRSCKIQSYNAKLITTPGTATDGTFSFYDCDFVQTDDTSKPIGSVIQLTGQRVYLKNCRFYPKTHNTDGASQDMFRFENTVGKDLFFDLTTQYDLGSGPEIALDDCGILWLKNSTLEQVKVDVTGMNVTTTPTRTDGGMFYLADGAGIKDIEVTGLDSDIGTVAVFYLAGVNTSPKSYLDGVLFKSVSGDFDCGSANGVIGLAGYAELRRCLWNDHNYSAISRIVHMFNSYNLVKECHFEVDHSSVGVETIVLVGGSATSSKGNKIVHNDFVMTPDNPVDPTEPTAHRHCIYVFGKGFSADADDGHLYMTISENTFDYGDLMQDGTSVPVPYSSVIYAVGLYLSQVVNNNIKCRNDSGLTYDGVAAVYFYDQSIGDTTSLGYRTGGGNAINGNTIRAYNSAEECAIYWYDGTANRNASNASYLMAGGEEVVIVDG